MTGGLDAFFEPRGIAIIGASDTLARSGGKALFNLSRFGYKGMTYPVSPSHRELRGLRCYSSVIDVPDPVDLAVIAVSADRTPQALIECGRRGIRAAVVFALGFGGDTDEGKRLQAELEAAWRESHTRIIGPNTGGIRLVHTGVFATFASDIDLIMPGSTAIVTQSGGLGQYLGSYLRRRSVGTRYLVDTGNELDVGAAEVLEHIAEDPDVSCCGLILEGSREGRTLAEGVRRMVNRGKAVILLKTGRSQRASRQAASHTGALIGRVELFEAVMRAAGANIARDEMELADALMIHDARKAPRGRRLGVVTPSGGHAILTLDAAESSGLTVPDPLTPPTDEQKAHLRSGALTNPFDYWSTSVPGPATLKAALEWMLGQPNLDAVVTCQSFLLELEDRRREFESVLVEVARNAKTPLFGCGTTTPEFEVRLKELGVLWFDEPTRLVRAISVVAPADPETPPFGEPRSLPPKQRAIVGAPARILLTGIEHVRTVQVSDAAAAEALCREWGKTMLKVESDRYPHKTELGLVEGPLTEAEVAAAFGRLLQARRACSDDSAPIVAQPFERGVELGLGAYLDPSFGPAVMVAVGGIFIEVVRDVAFAVAPIERADAARLIESLRGAPLLRGIRNGRQADIEAAAGALAALSRFIAEADGSFESVDINPLIVREKGKGAVAVDAVLIPRGGVRPDRSH